MITDLAFWIFEIVFGVFFIGSILLLESAWINRKGNKT